MVPALWWRTKLLRCQTHEGPGATPGHVSKASRKRRKTQTERCPQRQRPPDDRSRRSRPWRLAQEDSYLKDKFFRLKARRGYLRAAVAIAHKILKAVYAMLSTGAEYHDLSSAYLDAVNAQRVKGNLVRRLERLGFDVAISPRPPAQPSEPEAEAVG